MCSESGASYLSISSNDLVVFEQTDRVEYFGWTGRIFHCSSRDHLRKLLVRFEDSTKKNIGTTDKRAETCFSWFAVEPVPQLRSRFAICTQWRGGRIRCPTTGRLVQEARLVNPSRVPSGNHRVCNRVLMAHALHVRRWPSDLSLDRR